MRRAITCGLAIMLPALLASVPAGASDSLPFLPGLLVAGPGAALIPVPPRVQNSANTLVALQPVYVPGSRDGWSAAVAIGTYTSGWGGTSSSWGSGNGWGDVGFGTTGTGAYDPVLQARYSVPAGGGYYTPFYYADPRFFGPRFFGM